MRIHHFALIAFGLAIGGAGVVASCSKKPKRPVPPVKLAPACTGASSRPPGALEDQCGPVDCITGSACWMGTSGASFQVCAQSVNSQCSGPTCLNLANGPPAGAGCKTNMDCCFGSCGWQMTQGVHGGLVAATAGACRPYDASDPADLCEPWGALDGGPIPDGMIADGLRDSGARFQCTRDMDCCTGHCGESNGVTTGCCAELAQPCCMPTPGGGLNCSDLNCCGGSSGVNYCNVTSGTCQIKSPVCIPPQGSCPGGGTSLFGGSQFCCSWGTVEPLCYATGVGDSGYQCCTNAAQCASQVDCCSPQVCVNGWCDSPTATVIPDAGPPAVYDGGPCWNEGAKGYCTSQRDCATGVCDTAHSCCAPLPIGSTCIYAADCQGNLDCVDGGCGPCAACSTNGGACCASGQACTASGCCPKAQQCGNQCCSSGQNCGPEGQCCPSTCNEGVCCGGETCQMGTCCPTGLNCGANCCPAGDKCVGGGITAQCCPTRAVCNNGSSCCPGGQVCAGDHHTCLPQPHR